MCLFVHRATTLAGSPECENNELAVASIVTMHEASSL